MAQLIHITQHSDQRGDLFAISDLDIGFPIKRSFYIFPRKDSIRGGHHHIVNKTAIICLQGQCRVHTLGSKGEQDFELNIPEQCLILEPSEWREMVSLTDSCILLVLASEYYDPTDYQHQK